MEYVIRGALLFALIYVAVLLLKRVGQPPANTGGVDEAGSADAAEDKTEQTGPDEGENAP